MEPNKYRSLISQMVEDCIDPPHHPITDLEYKSAGFKDIIKTGFRYVRRLLLTAILGSQKLFGTRGRIYRNETF